jgi:hypothetical protein
MDKLYWIVCEDKETTLFEGRYQGRTRGAALKFLKETLGRKSLNGLVFTVTEIPVPLIREIVAEMLAERKITSTANVVPPKAPEPSPPAGRHDALAETAEASSPPAEAPAPKKPSKTKSGAKVGNPGHGEDFWKKVRAHWEQCGNLREAARKFNLSPNSVKTRARREGWNK